MSSEVVAKPYRVAAGEGIADVWWKGGRLTVKAGGAETGNAFAQVETDDPRGTATPLHVHRHEDESFYVVEGEITVLVGDERIDLAAGDYAFAPRGVAHAYIVRSERARMLTTLSPSGLEELFVALGAPVGDGEPPEETMPPMDELIGLFAGYGCEILGPPPVLGSL